MHKSLQLNINNSECEIIKTFHYFYSYLSRKQYQKVAIYILKTPNFLTIKNYLRRINITLMNYFQLAL